MLGILVCGFEVERQNFTEQIISFVEKWNDTLGLSKVQRYLIKFVEINNSFYLPGML